MKCTKRERNTINCGSFWRCQSQILRPSTVFFRSSRKKPCVDPHHVVVPVFLLYRDVQKTWNSLRWPNYTKPSNNLENRSSRFQIISFKRHLPCNEHACIHTLRLRTCCLGSEVKLSDVSTLTPRSAASFRKWCVVCRYAYIYAHIQPFSHDSDFSSRAIYRHSCNAACNKV